MYSVSVEKLQRLEALSGEINYHPNRDDIIALFVLISELTSCLWQNMLPGLRSRVKDPTCSKQLAPLLVSLTDFSLEW